ncbi:MAG: NAD-dependent epimerase/dehydratase family protein [Anaerolineae bacterium]
MRYFVTGATGFIGGRVARMLVAAGHEVVAVARNPAAASDLGNLGVEVVAGDVTDKESLRGPMTGVDGVYHIAGWYRVGVKDKSQAVKINVDGTRNVLEVMRELAIPRGVYTSTLAVNSDTHGRVVDETYHTTGPFLSEYDRTKWVAHYQVAEPMIAEGLPLVIVMPGVVYGIGDTSSIRTTFLQYLERKLPVIPQRTAFCWATVEDTAQGHLLAMEKGRVGESYMICGEPYTLVEALDLAETVTGISRPTSVPPFVLRAGSSVMRLVEKGVSVPEQFSSENLRVTAGVTYLGSNARAKRELGFAPRPLEEGLPEMLYHEMGLLGLEPKPRQS